MFNEKIIEHFINPRNVGIMEDPDGFGVEGDPGCGDYMEVYIKVRDHRITDIRFQVRGCVAAIACGSAMTELAMGKSIDEAMEIEPADIEAYLGGLPEVKSHCSNLGAGALKDAVWGYVINSNKKNKQQEAAEGV